MIQTILLGYDGAPPPAPRYPADACPWLGNATSGEENELVCTVCGCASLSSTPAAAFCRMLPGLSRSRCGWPQAVSARRRSD